MRVFSQRPWRTLLILTLISAAISGLSATALLANGNTKNVPAVKQNAPVCPAMPAGPGAGSATIVRASNVGAQAWIYTSDWANSTPEQTTGSIELVANHPMAATATSASDTADMVARFIYPPNSGTNYVVRFTCVNPSGWGFTGIGIMQPVFGSSGPGLSGINLPRTLAYVTVPGNATITKDGTTIASNQPAVALVTQAIHDSFGKLLSEADPTRREFQLAVPGSLMSDGTAVPGFPNGNFYIVWPDAALDINNVGGRVQLSSLTTTTMPAAGATGAMPGRGPAGTPLTLTLTNSGIQKSIANPPAGLYAVTIVNKSSKPMGLYMTGTDICCTEFNRYSKVLAPGKSQTFRFYFAQGKVTFRDLLKCEKGARSCIVATYGPHSTSMTFQ